MGIFSTSENDAALEGQEVVCEVQFKRVVRKGKIIRKAQCPPGSKFQGGKCVRIKSKERIARKKAGIKTARKVRAKSKQIARKRARSLKKRKGF